MISLILEINIVAKYINYNNYLLLNIRKVIYVYTIYLYLV